MITRPSRQAICSCDKNPSNKLYIPKADNFSMSDSLFLFHRVCDRHVGQLITKYFAENFRGDRDQIGKTCIWL